MDDNLIVFLGRFHPLVVHLPIGILLLAGLMELISYKSKAYSRALKPAVSFTLFWGGISSLGAIAIGWLLSLQGAYDDNTLFWHKWLGIALTILSFFAWILKSNKIRLHKSMFQIVFGSVIILVAVTGHLGGNLTHGDSYLTHYAPNFIKKIVGADVSENNELMMNIHPDSIEVFPYFIQPIFEKKCNNCHNSTKKEGGLLLTSHHDLFEGGDHGSILNMRNPMESELINRVTLPKLHKKFMPPKGEPLTFGEIQIIEWWMRSGADSIAKFSDAESLDEDIIYTILRDYQIDYSPKPYYEKIQVDSLAAATIKELRDNQFSIDFMGENSNMIALSFKGKLIEEGQLKALELAKDQITWLNLSNCNLTDDILRYLEQLTNLTRLNVHSNPLTDKGVNSLANFKHLSSLNVYNTEMTNVGVAQLAKLPSLKKLYIWKTELTPEEIIALKNDHSHIEIIGNLN